MYIQNHKHSRTYVQCPFANEYTDKHDGSPDCHQVHRELGTYGFLATGFQTMINLTSPCQLPIRWTLAITNFFCPPQSIPAIYQAQIVAARQPWPLTRTNAYGNGLFLTGKVHSLDNIFVTEGSPSTGESHEENVWSISHLWAKVKPEVSGSSPIQSNFLCSSETDLKLYPVSFQFLFHQV